MSTDHFWGFRISHYAMIVGLPEATPTEGGIQSTVVGTIITWFLSAAKLKRNYYDKTYRA